MSRLFWMTAFCSLVTINGFHASMARAQDLGAPRPGEDPTTFLFAKLNESVARNASPVTIEGLSKEIPTEPLTWERAYSLALVRSRDKGRALALKLDPKALEEQAKRLEVADFGRFRQEFLNSEAGGFRDPSARFFDLLSRSQAIEHATAHLAAGVTLQKIVRELRNGETSGLTQLQMDQVSSSVVRTRLQLSERQTRYRDALDEFKVELGLSPRSQIALDRSPLARFQMVFDKLSRWSVNPRRELDTLNELASELPNLGDLAIGGGSLLEAVVADSPRFEELVTIAGSVASDPSLELLIRRRVRKSGELATAYQIGQRQLVLILAERDQAFEQMIAPPMPGGPLNANGPLKLANLLDHEASLWDCKDRLIEAWTSYHALRLALYRDLKILPAGDWKAFYDQALATKDDPARIPPPRPARKAPASPEAQSVIPPSPARPPG